jgi:hypothetical protein
VSARRTGPRRRSGQDLIYGPLLQDQTLEPLARVTRYFRALTDDHVGRGCLQEAQKQGQPTAERDVTELAELLIEAWESAVIRVNFRFLAHAIWTTEEALAKLGAVTVPA